MGIRAPLLKDLLHIAHPLGRIVMAFTFAYAAPGVLAAWLGEPCVTAFGAGAAANLGLGGLLYGLGRIYRRELRARDGYLLVALVWIVLAASAALPLWLALPQLSWTDAYFETTSALTTSGATVLGGLDTLPRSLNLWRAELQWLGGMGVIALAMAVLPLLGVGGMQLYRSAAAGPIRDSRMAPRLRQTIRSIWPVYIGLTVLCMLALKLAGMSWFDALCHAFSTLSLGGFSTHDASVGYFHSPAIEAVIGVFMLIAALNFATHFAALRAGSLRPYRLDPEAATCLKLIVGSGIAVAIYLWLTGSYATPLQALRYGLFNVVSLATSCGLVSTDFNVWPLAAPLWMLLLSCISPSIGSTGGGIKMVRTLILFRQSGRELRLLMHPSAMQALKVGGRVIPDEVVSSVLGFIHLYTLSIVSLTFAMILSGADFLTAFSAIIATINNAGPGLHGVGPHHSFVGLTDLQTWLCTVSMLLGRLEIFVLVVPFTRAYWRD